ncbi:MAG: hypothetical protein D6784_09245, partial [Chloroflexi bacterium]
LLFLLTAGAGLFFLAPPVSALLNARFADPDWSQRDGRRIVRQSVWVAVLGVLLLYLQMVRALNLSVALSLTVGFMLLEIYFLLRA